MTEKTLSILGVIKKKLDNLDRNAKTNSAVDLSNEFDYVISAKKSSDTTSSSDINSSKKDQDQQSNDKNKIYEYNLGDLEPKVQEANQNSNNNQDNNQESKEPENSANSVTNQAVGDKTKDHNLDIALTNFDEELESIIEEYEDELSDADLDGGSAMNSIFNITLRQIPKQDDQDSNFADSNHGLDGDFNTDNSENKLDEFGNNDFSLNSNSSSSANNEFNFNSDLNEAEHKLFGDSTNFDFAKKTENENNSPPSLDQSFEANQDFQLNNNSEIIADPNIEPTKTQDSDPLANMTFEIDHNNQNLASVNSTLQTNNEIDHGNELDFNLNISHDNHLDFSIANPNNHQDNHESKQVMENKEFKQELQNKSEEFNLENNDQNSLIDENTLKKQQIISDFENDIAPQISNKQDADFNLNQNPNNNSNRMLSALKGSSNNTNNITLVQQGQLLVSDVDNSNNTKNNFDFELSDHEIADLKIFGNNQNSFVEKNIDHQLTFDVSNSLPSINSADSALDDFHNFNQDNNQFGHSVNQQSLKDNNDHFKNSLANNNFHNPAKQIEENNQHLEENIQHPQLDNFIDDLHHHPEDFNHSIASDNSAINANIDPVNNPPKNNFSNIIEPHVEDQDENVNQDILQNSLTDYQPQVSKPLLNEDVIVQSATSVQQLINAKTLMSGINNFMQSPYPLEIAIQLMEPKLEQWLNENLSQIVEKVVRDEIKRIMPK